MSGLLRLVRTRYRPKTRDLHGRDERRIAGPFRHRFPPLPETTMTTIQTTPATADQTPAAAPVGLRLEVVILPVSDVDRTKRFYASLGWREDADFPIRDDFRVVQMTPPDSAASIIFGTGVTAAAPGSVTSLLAVYDIEAARADLVARGADVTEVFHGAPAFDLAGAPARISGPDPERRSYQSYAIFSDPDGNRWLLQELTTRLPGR
jgi:catechol 2,3-dioxygenase-like lactoylglutathione lyase family enzyme